MQFRWHIIDKVYTYVVAGRELTVFEVLGPNVMNNVNSLRNVDVLAEKC